MQDCNERCNKWGKIRLPNTIPWSGGEWNPSLMFHKRLRFREPSFGFKGVGIVKVPTVVMYSPNRCTYGGLQSDKISWVKLPRRVDNGHR